MKHKALIIFSGVISLHATLIAVLCLANGCKAPEALRQRKYIPAKTSQPQSTAPLTIEQSEEITVKKDDKTVFQEKVTVKREVLPVPKTPGLSYTVKKNDSLSRIAAMYGVSVGELASFNDLDTKKILKIGQVVNIPPGGKLNLNYKPRRVKRRRTTIKKAKSVAPETALPLSGNTYTVKSGDSLWTIARKLNVKSSDIAKANNLSKSSVLRIGQKLAIPGRAGSPAPVAKTPAKKTGKAIDELLNSVDAKVSSKTAPAPAPKDKTVVSMDTETIEVPEDVTLEKFCRDFGIKVESLKKLNHDLPANGKLKAGRMIIIPK